MIGRRISPRSIAYYAFFSLFPLLLAFVSILGFVLEGNPSLRDDVLDTALGRIPVIGAQLRGQIEPLPGSGIALAVGLAGALWAGLGVTVALGRAFAEIWDVPRLDQPGGLKARGRGLAVMAILGVTLIVATAAAGRRRRRPPARGASGARPSSARSRSTSWCS